jgi:hypothetical protein
LVEHLAALYQDQDAGETPRPSQQQDESNCLKIWRSATIAVILLPALHCDRMNCWF